MVYGWVARDCAIKQRLRECRLVALIVTVAPVADQVDNGVALELPPIIEGKFRGLQYCFGLIAIHVKDRNLKYLCSIASFVAKSRSR